MRILCLFLNVFFIFSLPILANSSNDIYNRHCIICHAPSMATMFGAPAAHDLLSWNERKENMFNKISSTNNDIKKSSGIEKDVYILDALVNSAKNGTDKGMPPKGTCSDCTDEELRSVIKFMSSSE